MTDRRPSSPGDLHIREARDRFLDEYRIDSTDRTVRSYDNRLSQFCFWCEEEQIESVGDLSGWDLDEYRRSLTENSPDTVKGKMMVVKLAPADAMALLRHYRNSPAYRGTSRHASLEVFWYTGCRMSGFRALDL